MRSMTVPTVELVDTNVLLYGADAGAGAKFDIAIEL